MGNELSTLRGWIDGRRAHGRLMFIDVKNQDGRSQAVLKSGSLREQEFNTIRRAPLESGVVFQGSWVTTRRGDEFHVKHVQACHPATLRVVRPGTAPPERSISGSTLNSRLGGRHIQIRNPATMAALKARHRVHQFLAEWLDNDGFIELHAPILTQLPLYDDETAIALRLHGQDLFLTQCAGYYLETAAHGLERVYNIGPGFRAEGSRSPRHLVEYWHVKIEVAWSALEDIIGLTERLILGVVEYANRHCRDLAADMGTGMARVPTLPFGRISYREVIALLQERGGKAQFGDHIGPREEDLLADMFDRPFWITGNPRATEPFPHKIDPKYPDCTITAGLIIPGGYGELLGVAEKITSEAELVERMTEKHKNPNGPYRWLLDIRRYGCVPHYGMGMGFDRLLRWLFQAPHVREFVAFPRVSGRPYWP